MNTKETLDQYFVPYSFTEMWPRIAGKYEYFNFQDKLTDDQRYNEFVWVNEQLRKYIGKQQAGIMSKIYDFEALLKHVESLLADASEKIPVDEDQSIRPRLVYIAMRNEWLAAVRYAIQMLMEVEDGSYGVE